MSTHDKHMTSRGCAKLVCKIPLLARRTRPMQPGRRTRPKGRPSAARDDRVSCIQVQSANV